MRLGLVLGEAAQGLRRNVAMVISVILVTFISLTFVGAAILMQMQIGQMKGYWYDRAQVAIYLCTSIDNTGNCTGSAASPAEIAAVKAQLDSAALKPYIKAVSFETNAEAYRNFKSQFAGSPLLAFTTPSMLNESFRVNLKDPNQADIIIEDTSSLAGVQDVEDQRPHPLDMARVGVVLDAGRLVRATEADQVRAYHAVARFDQDRNHLAVQKGPGRLPM